MTPHVRVLVLQACCATGGIVGLERGFLSALAEVQATETMLAVGWHVLAGVVAGAFCAWTITVLLPWCWSRRA
jgi:hypothetical protein